MTNASNAGTSPAPRDDRTRTEDILESLQAEIRAFVAERAWEPFHDPKNLAMCLASEAGELLSELRWVDNREADAFCKQPETRQRVRDEVADVTLSLLMLVDRLQIDLASAVRDKLDRVREKYPVDAAPP